MTALPNDTIEIAQFRKLHEMLDQPTTPGARLKLALAIALLASSAAHANGPAPAAPVAPITPSQAISAQATAQAAASAQAQGVGGAGGSGSASLIGDRSLSLFVPPPSFTPPMAALAGCAPVITQSAWSAHLLIAGGSHAESRTDPTDCTLIILHNAAVARCRYATAQQIADKLTLKLLPGFTPSGETFTDYSQTECLALMTPPAPRRVVEFESIAPYGQLRFGEAVAACEGSGKAKVATRTRKRTGGAGIGLSCPAR